MKSKQRKNLSDARILVTVICGAFLLALSLRAASEAYQATHRKALPVFATTTQAPKTLPPAQPIVSPQPTAQLTSGMHIPILMYHYIRTVSDPKDSLGFNLSVTPQNFDAQLEWLETHGYHTFPLAEFCQGQVPQAPNPIILTFDDGYDDAYSQALPMLQKHHFTGTFFIITGFLDQSRYLTTSQVQQMRDASMEIGSHTVTHINLATASAAKQKEEIEGSKQSSPVFAYPSGQYSSETIHITKDAGFLCAVTTKPGLASNGSPLFELPRVRISGHDDLVSFADKVQGKK